MQLELQFAFFWFDADALDHDKIAAFRDKSKLKLKNRSISEEKKTRNLIYRTAAVFRYGTLDPHGWTVL